MNSPDTAARLTDLEAVLRARGGACCNQEQACGLEQGLNDGAEPAVALGDNCSRLHADRIRGSDGIKDRRLALRSQASEYLKGRLGRSLDQARYGRIGRESFPERPGPEPALDRVARLAAVLTAGERAGASLAQRRAEIERRDSPKECTCMHGESGGACGATARMCCMGRLCCSGSHGWRT